MKTLNERERVTIKIAMLAFGEHVSSQGSKAFLRWEGHLGGVAPLTEKEIWKFLIEFEKLEALQIESRTDLVTAKELSKQHGVPVKKLTAWLYHNGHHPLVTQGTFNVWLKAHVSTVDWERVRYECK